MGNRCLRLSRRRRGFHLYTHLPAVSRAPLPLYTHLPAASRALLPLYTHLPAASRGPACLPRRVTTACCTGTRFLLSSARSFARPSFLPTLICPQFRVPPPASSLRTHLPEVSRGLPGRVTAGCAGTRFLLSSTRSFARLPFLRTLICPQFRVVPPTLYAVPLHASARSFRWSGV